MLSHSGKRWIKQGRGKYVIDTNYRYYLSHIPAEPAIRVYDQNMVLLANVITAANKPVLAAAGTVVFQSIMRQVNATGGFIETWGSWIWLYD